MRIGVLTALYKTLPFEEALDRAAAAAWSLPVSQAWPSSLGNCFAAVITTESPGRMIPKW